MNEHIYQNEMEMNAVVERLRVSKEESDSKRQQAGRDAGIHWAKLSASYEELSRLHDFHADTQAWQVTFEVLGQCAYTVAEQVYFVICPEDDSDRRTAEDFWLVELGHDAESRANIAQAAFILGFCEGALEVFDEVKNRV